MKTREQIYGNEAEDLLRNVTMYKMLTEEQAYRLYPGKEAVIKILLSHLIRQGRVYRNADQKRVSVSAEYDGKPDNGLSAAVWVLIDFIDKAEQHYAGNFPVKICFFAEGEVYEIIHIQYGQEALMNHALAETEDTEARRIVLVDLPSQIGVIDIPGAIGFCSVEEDGVVRYYQRSDE